MTTTADRTSQSATRGFTLIELLVVIAIIGILSSVVLASLNTARNRGADAAIKSNLSSARTEGELWYDTNNNSYASVCGTAAGQAGPKIEAALVAQGKTVTARDSIAETCFVTSNGSGWAASVPLKTNSAQFYCIDSTGQSVTSATFAISATDVTCP